MEDKKNIFRGRYKVIREIARGGMGVVYLALDLLKNREVAVKKSFFSDRKQSRKGFEIEAKLLARLEHEGLPKVLDYFFLEDDSQALVMDYIGGETLADVLESGAFRVGDGLDSSKVMDWTVQILDILCYLHNFEPPVVHRDIKPNNIKLTTEGKIILLDFGLAKGSAVTLVGGMSGYSPLEQVNRTGTDPRSDIYALGTTLFHLLTNECPLTAFERFGQSYGQSLFPETNNQDHISTKPLSEKTIIELNSQVPKIVSEIVTKAMSLMPEDRFQTAGEMKLDVLKAKRSLAYGISKIGAATNFNISADSEKRQPVIGADEENMMAWQSQNPAEKLHPFKENLENTLIFTEPPKAGNDLKETIFVSDFVVGNFESERPRENSTKSFAVTESLNESQTFPQNFAQPELPQKNKKPVIFAAVGTVALILFASLGIFAWYWLATPTVSQTESPAAKNIADAGSSKEAETPKKLLQISTYSIGKNGKFSALDENYKFAGSEEFKFGITAPQKGFLYIVSRNNQAKAILAYPNQTQKDNSIKQNSEKMFPQNTNFKLSEDTWVYFVVVSSREDDLAKRIQKILDSTKEKSLSDAEVGGLFDELDLQAANSSKNNRETTKSANESIVGIIKLQKK